MERQTGFRNPLINKVERGILLKKALTTNLNVPIFAAHLLHRKRNDRWFSKDEKRQRPLWGHRVCRFLALILSQII